MNWKYQNCDENNCMDDDIISAQANRLCGNFETGLEISDISRDESCSLEYSPCTECVVTPVKNQSTFSKNFNFENFVNFTVNVFGESRKIEDVPFRYFPLSAKNHTSEHFPNDMENHPVFEKEPVFKYEHISIIGSMENLSEENVDFFQKDLENIVCTGQFGELPKSLGKFIKKEIVKLANLRISNSF